MLTLPKPATKQSRRRRQQAGNGVWELDATIDVRANSVVRIIGEVRERRTRAHPGRCHRQSNLVQYRSAEMKGRVEPSRPTSTCYARAATFQFEAM